MSRSSNQHYSKPLEPVVSVGSIPLFTVFLNFKKNKQTFSPVSTSYISRS